MGVKLMGRYAERMKGIEGEALEKLILKNVRDLITKGTQRAPLVAILEDLHWADTSSIELMESLFRLAAKDGSFLSMCSVLATLKQGTRSQRLSKKTIPRSTPRLCSNPWTKGRLKPSSRTSLT